MTTKTSKASEYEPGNDLPPRDPPERTKPGNQRSRQSAVVHTEKRREQMIEEALERRFGPRGRTLSEWYRTSDLDKKVERPSMLAVINERTRSGAEL